MSENSCNFKNFEFLQGNFAKIYRMKFLSLTGTFHESLGWKFQTCYSNPVFNLN